MTLKCKDWGNINKAKVLVIGHDPRLQRSNTIAEYCFFADYYFKDKTDDKQSKRKKGLAKSVFNLVFELTNQKYAAEEIYITNLCNEELPHSPKGKTVYIPEEKAVEGVNRIKNILKRGNFEYIFATSLQVNYWLQKLGVYSSESIFLENTEPVKRVTDNNKLYFRAKKAATFKIICGNIYKTNEEKINLIPVLHPKQYPLNSRMIKHYGYAYNKIKKYFK